MATTGEFPPHPFPHVPQPPQPQPQRPRVQQPMIYVYEKPAWEYKVVARSAGEPALSEAELNALGASGWELVGVVTRGHAIQFFFKRTQT